MFSAFKLVAAGAMLVVAGAFVVSGGPIGTRNGGPPNALASGDPLPAGDPGPAAYVHGTMTAFGCCGDYLETYDDSGNRLTARGTVHTGAIEMDDPRLSGDYTNSVSIDEFPQPDTTEGVEVNWGDLVIENAAGTWRGTWMSTYDSATETALVQYRFIGEGAYEGLSALLSETEWRYPIGKVAGAIFPGALPPR